MKSLVDFKALRLQLASAEDIRSWSHGEILKPETINYRTLKPEKDGLFCERIFGPTKDWECYCGKYKRIRYRGIICDKCGVEVTQSKVRRERMGHINLACLVAHVWFFKGAPSKLSLFLDISPRNMTAVIYFAKYVILDADADQRDGVVNDLDEKLGQKKNELKKASEDRIKQLEQEGSQAIREVKERLKAKEQRDVAIEEQTLKTKQLVQNTRESLVEEYDRAEEVFKTLTAMVKRLKRGSLLSEDEYLKLWEYDAARHLKVGMGAEALMELIKGINVDRLAAKLREEIQKSTGQKRVKITKRLRVVEGMKQAAINPEWMILKVLPVIPPDLRPMVQLSGGRFATSDLNDLYRRVINRNNRLKHLIDLGAPEIILRNEKRMLQEAVDALIDASQSKTRRQRRVKELRSLSDMLRGKQGRFRQNLLGKRVDYSGRSVIVVGPELTLSQCGLPKEMALEMFKPYVLRELIFQGIAPNVKSAKHVLERGLLEVYDILEEITKNHPVLLNRAPTLHKLGIQAFYPILIEGNAIRIHPCVCTGFNADFDGDQMAVHVPLGKKAREEAAEAMMPTQNLLKPADGSPITVPNKEMALGCYFLTSVNLSLAVAKTIFANSREALIAQQMGKVDLRQPIKVYVEGKVLDTTVGRLMFNEILPKELRYVNEPVTAGSIKVLVRRSLALYPSEEVADLIDRIKDLGFYGATVSGLSVAVSDFTVIPEKEALIQGANKRAEEIEANFRMGLITDEEKRRLTNEVWMDTTDEIADRTWENFNPENSVKLIIDSGGTRASKDQVKQLAAMRGLVVDPLGKIVELPTKSNFREGLSVFEYVTSTRGSRKGLTDSALKTADAGYLTRRLVDVAHDVIARKADCGTDQGIEVSKDGFRNHAFAQRLLGRVTVKKVVDGKTKKVLVKASQIIDEDGLADIQRSTVASVWVRSPLTCQSRFGVCARCYGWDFATRQLVTLGGPVGIVAAQSIGEPGTQLTMRVKHTGGIVGLDVTQGLPRVEELFEMRIPKLLSPLTEITGKVTVEETDRGYKVTVRTNTKPREEREYWVPLTMQLKVETGDLIAAGMQVAEGSVDVKEVLKVRGLLEAQLHLLGEIQKVYESQGIPINDRHFEVIIRKMSDKVKIEESGDTNLLPGEIVERSLFEAENEKVLASGGEPAIASILMLGITRSSLYTSSWLSAASFQETTNVLTDASIKGDVDPLIGMKENVIIGRLIPTDAERSEIAE